jgi:hypothetical protein
MSTVQYKTWNNFEQIQLNLEQAELIHKVTWRLKVATMELQESAVATQRATVTLPHQQTPGPLLGDRPVNTSSNNMRTGDAVFSLGSAPKLYKEGERNVEKVVRRSPAGKDVSTGAEESTVLEAAMYRGLVNTVTDWEYPVCAKVIC